MFEWLASGWSVAKFALKHRKTLERLGGAQEAIVEAESLRASISDLESEVERLKVENAELLERLNVRESLTFRDGVFWQVPPGGSDEVPVCPKCYQDEDKVIFLQSEDGYPHSWCPKCQGSWARSGSVL